MNPPPKLITIELLMPVVLLLAAVEARVRRVARRTVELWQAEDFYP